MTIKEQFCCELDTEFVRNFPDKYFDESYITSKDTVAFVGFINTVVERWCDILEKYAHYDTEYLASILKLDSSKAYCIFGAEIDERSRKVGREYLDIVRHLIEAIYVSGEMLKAEDFDDGVTLYNIHRKNA